MLDPKTHSLLPKVRPTGVFGGLVVIALASPRRSVLCGQRAICEKRQGRGAEDVSEKRLALREMRTQKADSLHLF